MSKYEEKNILSREQLALRLKQKHEDCKIIRITQISKIITIYHLLKKVEPHGFIIKSDIDVEELGLSVTQVNNGFKYHSATVKRIILEIRKNQLLVDEVNRQILLYLYQGNKIEEVKDFVYLSVSSIKRRIALLIAFFGIAPNSSLVNTLIMGEFL